MVIKPNYIIIPLVTIIVSALGGAITAGGMEWYDTINVPDWTPSGRIISIVWTTIFILTTISALITWNHPLSAHSLISPRIPWIAGFFILNAILNVFWSFLFFGQQQILAAFWEAIALDITVIVLIVMIWRISWFASVLLFPYAIWVAFASYLTWNVYLLNRG